MPFFGYLLGLGLGIILASFQDLKIMFVFSDMVVEYCVRKPFRCVYSVILDVK